MPSRTPEQVLKIINQSGVVAIVRLDDLSAAVLLTQALLAGGITAIEFTLTNSAALETIREVKATVAELTDGRAVIGAGTVLDAQAAKASVEAGAEFIVSPHTHLDTLAMCRKLGVPGMPGALTPTEIVTAWKAGASVVKVFPARAFGPAYLKDIRGPLPNIKLMPTGGVNLENTGQYIKHGAVAVGIGGNLVDKQLIQAGEWETLTHRAAAYVQAVQRART
jgi:2-dehydro-3-deoxyphosphogluconate aldolase/(4S)-4-hydroxy-2-oxoglutarate aldolase